jgi:hypothetical protein
MHVACGLLLASVVFATGTMKASTLRCVVSDERGNRLRNVEVRLTPAGTETHQYQKSNKKSEVVFPDLNVDRTNYRPSLMISCW